MKRRYLALGLALCVLPFAQASYAAGGAGAEQSGLPSSGLSMAMTIYAGGITIGKVDMDAKIVGDNYHVVSNLETSGMVNAFWQSQIQASSSGKIDGRTLQPALYDSFYTGHTEKHQEVSLSYENGTPVRLYANPPYSTTGYEVKADDKKSTFDPLSAVVYIASGLGAKADNPCSVLAPVYDGRRRYNIELTKVGEENKTMDNGLYKGPVLVCSIKYKQLAGFKPRVLKETNFPAIEAWVATFPSKIPGRSYAVPLRVWAKSQYGVIAVVATSVKVDGMEPKALGG
ncbi:MAG: DUF3108 domain-containing protein [Alphaproteobacteria bacterium]|nr:DUF3108 domain-containing protein [Alphaproteobacteria bacterium]MDE2629923.1 DUF3108 domain-containing protein [Alphaproteobacteria bacterium]